ncbi:hypothetical protein Salat_0058900 [Sesamum alatum]|uniref:Uncharacterized protein n=1 Tax=Sesamum alatum TaxID=300844 RepID=A0AAE1YUY7_9LAMI|nr:hypothetical protein Salat_0058900 [Sesamum alatum]
MDSYKYKHDNYDKVVQVQLDSAMPWIGMYIAAASALCSLAMILDAFRGLRSRRFWLPCKYFSLNAFSLTLLAVAMKLPVDFTSNTLGINDKLARTSSLVFMSTAMCNFMTSLGSMENTDIVLNLSALGILVITVAGNVCIHIAQMRSIFGLQEISAEQIGSIVLMLLLLVILCSSALMVPTAKRYIESGYQEMHKRVSNEKVDWGKFSIDELRVVVRRYWVMAETGSAQFVVGRSLTCVASGGMCLLMALTMLQALIRMPLVYRSLSVNYTVSSYYKWSINWIFVIQSIGVAFGSVAPLLRWFIAVQFKSLKPRHKSFKEEFKVETYWTQRLVDWRDSPLRLQIRHQECRKLVHDAKRLLLNFCIAVQIVIVRASKLVLLISAPCVNGMLSCFHRIKKLKACDSLESRTGTELDFSHYGLLLEGEPGLPDKILTNICNEADKLIQKGKKKQPKNVIKLLQRSVNFNGVREFDRGEIGSLHTQELPNCWSLPVVTLTSIAISLPNIDNHKIKQLVRGVSEGLSFVKLIEKTLDTNGELESLRNTADVIWVEVELYKKWQDKDLQVASPNGKTHKEMLQNLSSTAEKTVRDFINGRDDVVMQNPLNWPVKVIAANSMYRITQTMLLAHKDDDQLTDEQLFELLSIMISEIIAACLTNLARVITLKCHRNAIKEREESIRQAALLLGESEEILEILQQRDIPNLDPEKSADIEEWRAYIEASTSASGNHTARPQSNGEHVSDDEPEG